MEGGRERESMQAREKETGRECERENESELYFSYSKISRSIVLYTYSHFFLFLTVSLYSFNIVVAANSILLCGICFSTSRPLDNKALCLLTLSS